MTSRNSIKESVVDYCAKIGADPMLVQGAGGNVSWKDGDTLWVKASGTWLADAKVKDIFVPVDLRELQTKIKAGNFEDVPKVNSDLQLRPSIETLLHALMPYRVVVHVHAIEALVYLVRENAEKEIRHKLNSFTQWAIVSYEKPGEALATIAAEAIEMTPDAKILLLQNHGVIIGGDDIAEIEEQLSRLLSKLTAPPLNFECDILIPERIRVGSDQHYIPVDIPCIHSLAIDPYLFGRVKTDWALYPDHVVFLGHRSACYDSVQLCKEDLSGNPMSELIFIKEHGVFAKSGFSIAKQAQLKCYFDVIVRQPYDAHLKILNEVQISELINWDAERYRQHIAK